MDVIRYLIQDIFSYLIQYCIQMFNNSSKFKYLIQEIFSYLVQYYIQISNTGYTEKPNSVL